MPRASRKNRVYLQAYASMRLGGDDLDPSEVTRCLQLPPNTAIRNGDLRIGRSGAGRVLVHSPYRTGVWGMSSESWVNSWRLATHLEWLIGQLEPKAGALASLLEQGFEGDLFCFSLGRTQRPPPIPKPLRERASTLGLIIDIDHYDCSDDGETRSLGAPPRGTSDYD